MNLIKFDPWLTDRQPQLSRKSRYLPGVFDDVFGNGIGDFMGTDFATNVPSVNISETENGYHLEIAAPGLKKEDFTVSLDKNRLTVSAEKSTQHETTEAKFTRREFNYSSFNRSFELPKTVDRDQILARYEDGVLTLTVPKKAEVVKEEKGRVIEIA